MSVFVIAEAGSSHDNDFDKARRLIVAAKECGASCVKFQWTSNALAMAQRRGLGTEAVRMYSNYLMKPVSWLEDLERECDRVGIEFACTVFLVQDIAVINPLVKRFKISAFESTWVEFVKAHLQYLKPLVISINRGFTNYPMELFKGSPQNMAPFNYMHCVSEYPTPIERLNIRRAGEVGGLSDHSVSLVSGAAAVGAGAKVIEKHIRLHDTDPGNPDYGHSLVADGRHTYLSDIGKGPPIVHHPPFGVYVSNVREAEKAL